MNKINSIKQKLIILILSIFMFNCAGGVEEISYDNPRDPESATGPLIGIVDENGDSIAASYNYGDVFVGDSPGLGFIILNYGRETLEISDLTISNTTDFTLDASATTGSITPNDSSGMGFTVSFNPQSRGTKTATVTIQSNDPDYNAYTFLFDGNGIRNSGMIEVRVDSPDGEIIANGGSYYYGNFPVSGVWETEWFHVYNVGIQNLEISSLTISNETDFDLTSSSMDYLLTTQSPYDHTYFLIDFDPASTGSKSCTVTISNDDPENSTFTFTVTGTGILKHYRSGNYANSCNSPRFQTQPATTRNQY